VSRRPEGGHTLDVRLAGVGGSVLVLATLLVRQLLAG